MRKRAGRKAVADEAIIVAAERLFAQHGVKNVSLRQIRQASGSANNGAVQYHFRDRAGLVRAVYERHVPELERRRRDLYERAVDDGLENDPATLVEVLLRPISEIRDETGLRNYAAFQLMLYAIERDPSYRNSLQPHTVTAEIRERLYERLPPLSAAMFQYRWAVASMVFLDAMVRLNEEAAPLKEAAMIEEALSLATALLQQPATAGGVRPRTASPRRSPKSATKPLPSEKAS